MKMIIKGADRAASFLIGAAPQGSAGRLHRTVRHDHGRRLSTSTRFQR